MKWCARMACFGLCMAGAGAPASAKPHDIRIDLKLEVRSSIHVPTGCIAAVEYDDGTFVRAFITDPLCLPTGIARRYVPAREADFYTLDPQQASIIGQ